ncbi:Lactation elevated protein 1 [Hordeum vulgare]|nr:Lactation elevated protein 1 [Hordeum vulgare]
MDASLLPPVTVEVAHAPSPWADLVAGHVGPAVAQASAAPARKRRWAACLEQVRNALLSGTVESDYDKIAQHRYKDMEALKGKFFKLEHCWELLQKCEKWKLIDKESLLLAEEDKIMSMNRDDMDDLTKTWHDMARREILKRRMVFSAPYCGNGAE